MIRVLVLVLVAANVLYFGWSRWVREETPRLVTPSAAIDTQVAALPPPPCTTIGPIDDETQALEIDALLRDRQLTPARRVITTSEHAGWWVYVASADVAGQERVLRRIQRAGMQDAFAMPDDATFRVSVGLFREEAGARSRAETVGSLALDAIVEERFEPKATVWFDLPGTPHETMDLSRIGAEGVDVASLRVEACPEGADIDIDSIVEQPAGPATGDSATAPASP